MLVEKYLFYIFHILWWYFVDMCDDLCHTFYSETPIYHAPIYPKLRFNAGISFPLIFF